MFKKQFTPSCTSPECERAIHAKGLCHRHYCAARRKGQLPGPVCSVASCGRPAICRKLCGMHAHRLERHGDPLARKKAGNGEVGSEPCRVEGCDRSGQATHEGRIYCNVHLYRVKTHGDPHTVKKLGNGQSTPDREKAMAKERHRRYLATPHGKMRSRFNASKVRAKKYGCDHTAGITKDVWLTLYAQTHCGICKRAFGPNEKKTIDHIIPLAKGGANDPANLQMAHPSCNFSKNDG